MRTQLKIGAAFIFLFLLCGILFLAWMGDSGEGPPELWVWILLAS